MRAQSLQYFQNTNRPAPAPRTIHCRTVTMGNVERTTCH